MSQDLDLGHTFKDPSLLHLSLSHPSLSSENRPPPPDNQRLEFLGDAVLDLVISEYLYQKFPHQNEGSLTKLRSSLVSRPALAKFARRINLGDHLLMSHGEAANCGRERDSNLADAIESVIGAIYLDAGLSATRTFILNLFQDELESLNIEDMGSTNPKGELQEKLQTLSNESPVYEITKEAGPPHDRSFLSRVIWNHLILATGQGNSKKAAEIQAAANALKEKRWEKP